jgi:hypothetical protein
MGADICQRTFPSRLTGKASGNSEGSVGVCEVGVLGWVEDGVPIDLLHKYYMLE